MKAAAWVGLAVAIAAGTSIAFRSTPTEKPTLLVLTSLPILFGEGFGLDQAPSPVLARLEKDYRVKPIDVADGRSLVGGRILLMAHPRAQPAEALVALDNWVRGGASVLLLADPRLVWPSDKPLGDLTRPPPNFADTGLLRHWGLSLITFSGRSEGVLRASPGSRCSIDLAGLVARCRVGRGQATVIADADFLGGASPDTDRLAGELSRLTSQR